ncbi:MAG: flagellar hook-associated protein FlgK, partial [Planctomycetes bacterium]|nr:flagellar hook-associated protein FlgK [Planctomycetota bacterium]
MGLFGALNVGRNAVAANQVALDTIGNNIANASNEGYSRQRVEFETLPPSRYGQHFIGNGVAIADVRRIFDQQVENRLKTAVSTLGSLERQSDAYEQLERVINALGDDPANGVY